MTAGHDDDVLGKAYDARLMRRLAHYLWPYWRQIALSFVAIIVGAAAQLAQPYLMKVAIDRYIATGQLAPLDRLAALYFAILVVAFVADYAQTWTMQLTGQKLMFDLRMELYGHLQRLDLRYYDRNPVGRLMTRVTSDVDVLNDLFTSGVVTVFGDVFMLVGIMAVMLWMDWRLALVSFCVRAADRRSSRSGFGPTSVSRTGSCAGGSPGSTRFCRRTSPACRRCSCSGARR